jgi:ATP-binding cassette subfamily B protein
MLKFREEDRYLYWRTLVGNTFFVVLATVGFYALFVRIAQRVLSGVLTVGDVTIYSTTTIKLRGNLQDIVLSIRDVREQLLYLHDLRHFLQIEPRMPATGAPVPNNNGVIECKELSFTYPGSKQPVLEQVSFRLEPGETVAIVGANGAGKSTLVKLLARLYEPTSGAIYFNETPITAFAPNAWQERIGFVFQQFNRYEATARENIAYGDWHHLQENPLLVQEIAKQAQIHELITGLPEGYDTLLGRKFGVHKPSLGQWQKIAIARALARRDSLLLILDEPTASLDAYAEYDLFCQFRELAAGRTTILISHRFSTIGMADRILVLDQGRLVESGSHSELLAHNGHYAKLYRLHQTQMGATAGNNHAPDAGAGVEPLPTSPHFVTNGNGATIAHTP